MLQQDLPRNWEYMTVQTKTAYESLRFLPGNVLHAKQPLFSPGLPIMWQRIGP
jgi:hypothetical protein